MSILRVRNVCDILGGMSMEAVGGYFRGLREGQDMSPADVASRLREVLGRKVDPTTVWRIETGRQNPGADLLLGLINVLKGRLADVEAIFSRADASAAEGEALGRRVAAKGFEHLTDDDLAILGQLSPSQRKAALIFLRQMLQES